MLIAAERQPTPVSELLAGIQHQHGEDEVVLSSVTVIELEHGMHRRRSAQQAEARRKYLETVFAALPVEACNKEMARIAAKVDSDSRKVGKVIPFADLLIGVIALYYGYSIGTRNLRHFQMIPNLPVLSL